MNEYPRVTISVKTHDRIRRLALRKKVSMKTVAEEIIAAGLKAKHW